MTDETTVKQRSNADLPAMSVEQLRAEERRLLAGLVPGTAVAAEGPRNTTPDLDRIVAIRVELDRRDQWQGWQPPIRPVFARGCRR